MFTIRVIGECDSHLTHPHSHGKVWVWCSRCDSLNKDCTSGNCKGMVGSNVDKRSDSTSNYQLLLLFFCGEKGPGEMYLGGEFQT